MSRLNDTSSTPTNQYSKLKSFFTKPKCTDTISTTSLPKRGDIIQLDGLGGSCELTGGETTTLQNLVDISVGGVILFTYPKANTPGCTAQACLFRDSYQNLTDLGFAVYGLSRDSSNVNGSFKAKNELPFSLICNTDGTLINALEFAKPPKGTVRGVIVIDKEGKVLASMIGSPNETVKAVYGICEAQDPYCPWKEADKIKETTRTVESMGVNLDDKGRQQVADTVVDVAGQVNAVAQQLDREASNASGAGKVVAVKQ